LHVIAITIRAAAAGGGVFFKGKKKLNFIFRPDDDADLISFVKAQMPQKI
jgi:hypothetical protein